MQNVTLEPLFKSGLHQIQNITKVPESSPQTARALTTPVIATVTIVTDSNRHSLIVKDLLT